MKIGHPPPHEESHQLTELLPRSPLAELVTRLDGWLDKLLSVRHWQWRVVWISLLLSVVHMVLTNPSCLWFYQHFFTVLLAGQEFDTYNVVKMQASTFFTDLGLSHFTNAAYASESHNAKMQFRLLLPALTALFGISRVSLTFWILQLLLSGVFVVIATRLAFRMTGDRVCSFLFVLVLSLLYPLRSAWLDITAYGDFFAYFLLLISLYTRRPIILFLSLQAAFWADERAVMGSCFIFLWHVMATLTARQTYRITTAQLVIAASCVCYISVKYWLRLHFNIPSTEMQYIGEFKTTYIENSKIIGFKIWSGFQGAWLLIILSFSLLLYSRRYVDFALLFGFLLLTINLSFIVVDVNRAISYNYLVLFCALSTLVKLTTTTELRRVLGIVLASLLICPLPNRLRIVMGIPLM
ncbi:MAG: hypothetical protein EOO39_02180 [Cytophagaceae bacterium]|nr:MAG: hypothetical protein EOO39_02180 [Cytophagaceae bacterium]